MQQDSRAYAGMQALCLSPRSVAPELPAQASHNVAELRAAVASALETPAGAVEAKS